MPSWIDALAALSLATGLFCALWIAWDVSRRPQPMAIMAVVWPVTALYGGLMGLWAYRRFGRAAPEGGHRHGHGHGHDHGHAPEHDHGVDREGRQPPGLAAISKGTLHCGAGCTLGDLIAETLLAVAPGLAMALGWQKLWSDRIFSAWILDFLLAFALGILFQYFSIKPMHPDMSRGEALAKALQADALSLVSWQVGMYALMALAHFWVFPHLVGTDLPPAGLAFWWVMQFAMMAGFVTAWPVNRWLIARGVKEAM